MLSIVQAFEKHFSARLPGLTLLTRSDDTLPLAEEAFSPVRAALRQKAGVTARYVKVNTLLLLLWQPVYVQTLVALRYAALLPWAHFRLQLHQGTVTGVFHPFEYRVLAHTRFAVADMVKDLDQAFSQGLSDLSEYLALREVICRQLISDLICQATCLADEDAPLCNSTIAHLNELLGKFCHMPYPTSLMRVNQKLCFQRIRCCEHIQLAGNRCSNCPRNRAGFCPEASA